MVELHVSVLNPQGKNIWERLKILKPGDLPLSIGDNRRNGDNKLEGYIYIFQCFSEESVIYHINRQEIAKLNPLNLQDLIRKTEKSARAIKLDRQNPEFETEIFYDVVRDTQLQKIGLKFVHVQETQNQS